MRKTRQDASEPAAWKATLRRGRVNCPCSARNVFRNSVSTAAFVQKGSLHMAALSLTGVDGEPRTTPHRGAAELGTSVKCIKCNVKFGTPFIIQQTFHF